MGGSRLLGRKTKKDDDDDIDDVLKDLEAKRGIQTTKNEESKQRPKTAVVFASQKEEWGALTKNKEEEELEDVDDATSRVSGNASQRGMTEQ